jgi:isopentenyl diphosphate isomerase/L-lactate dehydrogenase-like FMN-dependent dehydrogenase
MAGGGVANLSRAFSIDDLRTRARRRLPRAAFDFLDGGAEGERGLARNREAFDRVCLVPRYLTGIERRNRSVELFGRRYAEPFGIAPTGLPGLIWPGVDIALAEAAAAANIPATLSTPATAAIEDVAKAAPNHMWFQLYVPREKRIADDMVRRARDAGMGALLVTIDIPTAAKRERDLRNQLVMPLRPTLRHFYDLFRCPAWALAQLRHGQPRLANYAAYVPPSTKPQALRDFTAGQNRRGLDWAEIDRLRALWPGPFLVKGVMAVPDALAAVEHGCDGIVVSNHGGRQLDSAPATIEVLPDIAKAVGGRLKVLFDSGVRRGADIAKALALGADFVLVGRATLYGMAAGGRPGIDRAIDILRDEFDRTLAQIGCATPAGLGPGYISRPA